MYSLEFTYRFEAAHRFTKGSSECSTPHGHTWQATLGFASTSADLNSQHMVEEFKNLKKSWRNFITETADHSFFHHWQDPILPALRDHIPGFRGLPFPGDPTTEMIAVLFFEKAVAMTKNLPFTKFCQPSFVKIRETPTNSIVYYRENSKSAVLKELEGFDGWWVDFEPSSRRIVVH